MAENALGKQSMTYRIADDQIKALTNSTILSPNRGGGVIGNSVLGGGQVIGNGVLGGGQVI